MPVQKVWKCPKCGGAFLLWTGVCLRCGRIEGFRADARPAAEAPAPRPESPRPPSTRLDPARVPAPRDPAPAPASSRDTPLPIDDMFHTDADGAKTAAQLQVPDEATLRAARAAAADATPSNGRVSRTEEAPPPRGSTRIEKAAPPAPAPDPAPAPPPPPAPERRAAPGARHFLVLGYKDAIELVPGKRLAIGRHPSSNLRIDRPEVSRRHAELDWQGEPPRPLIRDAGSANTFLNGRPVAPESGDFLNDGDEIGLGRGFKMAYRFTATLSFETARAASASRAPSQRVEKPASDAGRAPADAPARPPAASDVASEGDFARTPAYVVLDELLKNGRSGVLRFTTSTGSGTILLEQGRPKTVIYGTRTGADAIEEVVSLTQGTFRFQET